MSGAITQQVEALEKRCRDLSKVIVSHLGGGSEWFSQIGEEYFADPEAVAHELQRRKTDAFVTKKALVRANAQLLMESGNP